MDTFVIQKEVKADLKIKSGIQDNLNWYLINLENMMLMICTENLGSTSSQDKLYGGTIYPLRLTDKGLHYYDQGCYTWLLLEPRVQHEFSDYIAEEELLGGQK